MRDSVFFVFCLRRVSVRHSSKFCTYRSHFLLALTVSAQKWRIINSLFEWNESVRSNSLQPQTSYQSLRVRVKMLRRRDEAHARDIHTIAVDLSTIRNEFVYRAARQYNKIIMLNRIWPIEGVDKWEQVSRCTRSTVRWPLFSSPLWNVLSSRTSAAVSCRKTHFVKTKEINEMR